MAKGTEAWNAYQLGSRIDHVKQRHPELTEVVLTNMDEKASFLDAYEQLNAANCVSPDSVKYLMYKSNKDGECS